MTSSTECGLKRIFLSEDFIPVENKEIVNSNKKAIDKLFDLFFGLISCKIKYGPLKYNASIVIYIDNIHHFVTENSIRFTGNLNDPIIVAKILLFLSENYSKLSVSKKDFDDKYTKFLAWYLRREKPEIKSAEETQEKDIINHPEHYTKGGIEVREFIDSWHLDFNSGNVIKYVVRAPYKGTELQDLKKAQNYLNHLIELKEKEEANK
jgi:hypothetical protein